ncbi:hypothetical protein [Butyricicoccus sp. OF27-2pH9A]|uniref:hypothetical protein n=1 Tax=Butyricicoccus sp. OF27-2pH9A TaxID=3002517 RepID=UPI0022E268B5|nr:hypothetical protein [Butyricicoccus sp. OF27-2pH9A]
MIIKTAAQSLCGGFLLFGWRTGNTTPKPIEKIGIGPSEIGKSAGTKKVCRKGLTGEGVFSIIIAIPVK